MKNPNPPSQRTSAGGKPPAAVAPRKSRWGPPPPAAAPAGDKAASTSVRTPTHSADSRRHPAPPSPAQLARNPASAAAPLRPPMQQPGAPLRSPMQQPGAPLRLPTQQQAAETPPPPPYGFHNLDRRTTILADGTVRTYFALPPDYPFEAAPLPPIPHLPRAAPDLWPPHQPPPQYMPMPAVPHDTKRKHPADQDEGFPRHPKQPRQEPPRHPPQLPPHATVDPHALRRAFLKHAKMLNESSAQRRRYLEGGRVPCLACGRSSMDFADVHGLIMHAYNPPNAESFVDHIGLHKALCVLMGWDYTKVPDNSKGYQSLPADLVRASREDLIVWPPTVIIQNTATGRKKDGRCEGLGNKDMDKRIAELGFYGGKSKSLYGKEGHLGVTLIKFADNSAGLKEAERLAEFLERKGHGRIGWSRAQASHSVDSDQNPALFEVDNRTGERKRILYGYIAIASDLDELDCDSRKRAFLKSRREFNSSD